MKKEVYLGLGTNLGNRETNLKRAIEKIGEEACNIVESSSIYESEPWGFEADKEFLNMALKVETELSPVDLLTRLLLIETELGRKRVENQYTSRIIDIDILLYEDEVVKDDLLKIPHPRMQERKFVLIPLCELIPDKVHPVLGMTMMELLEACPDKSSVDKVGSFSQ